MTTTRTPTSGAADLPEALHRVIDDFERRERGIPQAHIAAALVTELRAALAAGQATAAQAGEYPALVCDYCGALTPDPWHSSGMLRGKMSKHIHSCDACAARGVAAAPAGATEMENLQRTAVGWQERALRAERNWGVCRRWAIAGGAPVEKLGDDPDQPFHAASPTIEGESNG